jgi:hypothetical protein
MTKKTSTPIDREFDQFYKAYPIHRGRQDAEKAWRRLSAKDRCAARDGIARYCAICQQQGVSYKYPQGYLNGRRWEDEADADPAPSPAPTGVGSGYRTDRRDNCRTISPHDGAAAPLPSRGGAGVGSDTPPDNLPDMAIW